MHRGRVQADGDRPDRRGRVRGVDDADGPRCRRAQVPVGRHRGAIGVHGGVAGLGLAAALVAHVELAAREGEFAGGDADVPRVLDRTGAWVERHDGVLPVERGVKGGPVGRVRGLAHQRGVGRRSPAVTRKVGAHRRERETGRRAEGAVGVDREPGQGVLLGKPEVLAVRRVRRAFLADGAIGQGLVDPGCGADRPDELVVRQVEDLQDHRLVGAGRREESPIRADGGAHELAELGEQPVTDRLDDLVVGDDQALLDGLANLVGAEPDGRTDSDAGPGEDEGDRGPADRGQAQLATAEAAGKRRLPGPPAMAFYLHVRVIPSMWWTADRRGRRTARVGSVRPRRGCAPRSSRSLRSARRRRRRTARSG